MSKCAVLSLCLVSLFSWATIPSTEREALIDLYEQAGGDQWISKDGWKTGEGEFGAPGTEGEWHGVYLNEDESHVVALLLRSNNLNGVVPESLSQLTELEALDLSMSNLGQFPVPVTRLEHLTRLDLIHANLDGTLPAEIGNLGNLQRCDLSFNRISGAIPAELKQLERLFWLNLSNNQITTLPDLSSMPILGTLLLDANQLSGPVPTWPMNGPNLNFVGLSDNRFDGEFPLAYAQYEGRLWINLNDNRISGFPKANWQGELTLDLFNNQLDESSCEALGDALAQGVAVNFFRQGGELFHCGVLKLRQVMPWMGNNSTEWRSEVMLFNPTNQTAVIHSVFSNQNSDIIRRISPRSTMTIPVIPSTRGFSVSHFSDTEGVVSTYRVAGLRSPSQFSQALTTGQSPLNASPHLFFPVLPQSLKSALTLIAPEASGSTEVLLRLYDSNGVVGSQTTTLQGSTPRAFLISDIFLGIAINSDLALEVTANADVPLLGSAFAFNDVNEPAMMQALPWAGAREDWVLPWAASSEQWTSNLAIFNPNNETVQVCITASQAEGGTQKVTQTLGANRLLTLETGTLFPEMRGYAIRVTSQSLIGEEARPVFANLQVGNREARPMSASPALTNAIDREKLSPLVLLPFPSIDDIPAVVIQAPDNQTDIEVMVLVQGGFGTLETKQIRLQGSRPFPILLQDFFDFPLQGPKAILAVSLSGEPIAGTIFNFNQFREPSMTQGINQTWVDLGLSLSHQPTCDGSSQTVVTVSNVGPFPLATTLEIVLEADGQIVARQPIEATATLGQVATVTFPDIAFEQNLVASVSAPLGERNFENNSIEINADSQVSFAASHRLHAASGDALSGVIHADEPSLTLPISRLHLPCGASLSFSVERLKMETLGEFRDPNYRFQKNWQSDPDAMCEWLPESASVRVAGLESGGVYRIQGTILPEGGQAQNFPDLFQLSQSAYPRGKMDFLGSLAFQPSQRLVFHPFDNRNWLPEAIFGGRPLTATSGDAMEDHVALARLAQALYSTSGLAGAKNLVLELPDGVLETGFRVFSFQANQASSATSLIVKGQGRNRTFITDSRLRPVPDNEAHYFSFESRITISDFDHVEAKDFSLWGAVPGEGPAMEVSGRPIALASGDRAEPYSWFSGGLRIKGSNTGKVADLDLRFHAVGITLQNNLIPFSAEESRITVEETRIAYADSGILLQDQSFTKLGPNIDIYHVSRQGIFANRTEDVIIEGNVIEGARQRGINFDQSKHIWIRDNQILDSGQTGVHFGGRVSFAAVTGNVIDRVNRDRPNSFGDENSIDGTTLFYRPVYEGIKSNRGQWGDSDHLWIANNTIRDVADGIAFGQGNASSVLIEGNDIQAWRRGVRLEFGKAKLFVQDGISFEAHLNHLFVMDDNSIGMFEPVSIDQAERHGVLFADHDVNCLGCNIDFMSSYGQDFGKRITFFPFPIEFFNYDGCNGDLQPECREWFSNEAMQNQGLVYLPTFGEVDFKHPNAQSQPLDAAAILLADQLRQTIQAKLP